MANLSYGSSGADVRELQEQLRAAGYNIAADGIFGPATQSAVRAYQQANGLQVDGIAGNQTRGALAGSSVAQTDYTPTVYPVSSGTGITTRTATTYTPREYSSPYRGQLDALYSQITSRQPFRYDLGGDSLYRQYSQQYQQLGQRAMQDTVGQTAALTGGYGSTYGQSAGQQAYQNYLAQLNNVVPELEQRAYNRYADEGNALLDRYNLLNDMEQQDYQRYRDQVAEEYQRYRDQVADSQWERQFAANQAAAAARAATANTSARTSYTPTTTAQTTRLQDGGNKNNNQSNYNAVVNQLHAWSEIGYSQNQLKAKLKEAWQQGGITTSEYKQIMRDIKEIKN